MKIWQITKFVQNCVHFQISTFKLQMGESIKNQVNLEYYLKTRYFCPENFATCARAEVVEIVNNSLIVMGCMLQLTALYLMQKKPVSMMVIAYMDFKCWYSWARKEKSVHSNVV